MRYSKTIHPIQYVVKSILGHTICSFLPKDKNQLLVLNYHGTQKKFIHNFALQINYLKDRFDIISPNDFKDIITGKTNLTGKKLLLTFDDGIKNNLQAIEILDRYNISAFFFIVPQFINTPVENQKSFFLKNIRPQINTAIDSEPEDFQALTWSDLKEISKRHAIGCHTNSHSMIKDQNSQAGLQVELIGSKETIEEQLRVNIDTFCSINNTLKSVGHAEKKIIEQVYAYHFTTFGGNNNGLDPNIIKRVNIESYWLTGAVKFALSNLELKRWKDNISEYEKY